MSVFLFIQFVLTGAVRSGTAVLFGTLGETVSEKAGVTNLGTEGCMLVGACFGFIVAAQTGNPLLAVLTAALAGGLLSLIHAFLVITRGANQLASGLALGFLGMGLTALIGRPYVSQNIEGLNVVQIPLLADIPALGPILFQHDLLTYFAYLLGPAIWLFLYRTRWGLSLRAVGESTAVAFSTGRNPRRIQYGAIFFGGLMAGLGGAQLSLAYTHSWVENMTAGRGFIAVALVIFGMWHPLRAILGAVVFGAAASLQFQLQPLGIEISPFFLLMLPYLLTLVILLILGRRSNSAAPAGLSAVFSRSS
jgi:simple sugar transport system permease protein